jgi:hypothetical protein
MKITVIVAAKNASSVIKESLTAWKHQLHSTDETIVAHASDDLTAEIVRRDFPTVKLLSLQKKSLIPELCTAAISQATGELIAITSANCVPRSTWVKHARILIASGVSAAGGAIESPKDASLSDTAAYFSRYWRYMPPFKARESDDLPRDNVIYRSSDLSMYRGLFSNGLWTAEINQAMINDGLHLLLSPDLTAIHKHSAGFFQFLSERFHHGLHFGRERSQQFGILKRFLYFLGAPLIPFILLSRIWNAAKIDSNLKRQFMHSLAILFLFLIAWAIGEGFGYLAGPVN